MIEDDIKNILAIVYNIEHKLDRLCECLLPDKKDYGTHIKKAKELSNKGKKPRRQPKKNKYYG